MYGLNNGYQTIINENTNYKRYNILHFNII